MKQIAPYLIEFYKKIKEAGEGKRKSPPLLHIITFLQEILPKKYKVTYIKSRYTRKFYSYSIIEKGVSVFESASGCKELIVFLNKHIEQFDRKEKIKKLEKEL